ncbi:hypothetical protein F4820DRAFT_36962 [Hypoxylon rubiginosum]|uniref:Uncharacterized protein n=1 Tax=Hypoxylon rubiginosum TaxID=110542 RepID=A0ACB9YSZ3_9PEZI|nr:hypothetical protein F4820DRAFT_36962 [Hypoxylon rubiginosum]
MSVTPGQYWNLIERNRPPVRRRANHAKVRTGCVTCKNRRVKCDEGKPQCLRCEKSGFLCVGYEDASANRGKDLPPLATSAISKRTTERTVLRPRSLQPRRAIDATQPFSLDIRLPASLTPAYLDGRDAPFFERFRSQIIMDIASWCSSNYWNGMLSQIMHDDCIQHASLALAAMLLAVERSLDPAGQSSGPLTQYEEGRVALRHYMKAISLCRQRLLGGITKDTIRSNLTSTFLFAMIEVLQGNMSTVDQIMVNGTLLLRDAINAKAPSGRPTLVWDQELAEMKGGFDRMTIMWGLCPFFHGQKEIYAVTTSNGQYPEMPDKDAPLSTIRRCWTMFQNDLGLFMMSVRCGKVVSPEHMESVISQNSKYIVQLRQWMSLIDMLLEREKNTSTFYPLGIMKALALTCTIFLSCFLDRSDVSYDLHLQSFLEILNICQKFIPEKPSAHLKFSLDVNIFPIASFTVTKCRDQKTRQLALKIFKEMTYRQVLWSNQGMLKSLQALVDLEHKGRDKRGFIPPSSRYYFVASEWDLESRQMMASFVCVVSVPTESGDLPTVRVPISF